eukprot:sb/3475171/
MWEKHAVFCTGREGWLPADQPEPTEPTEPTVAAAYVDDILIPAESFEDMFANLEVVFERFRLANLRLNPKKCEPTELLKYCGVYLTPDGVLVDEERTAAVRERWFLLNLTRIMLEKSGLSHIYVKRKVW